MLLNAMVVRLKFPEKSITKVYGSMLLALRGGGRGDFPETKRYVALEWPLISYLRTGVNILVIFSIQ